MVKGNINSRSAQPSLLWGDTAQRQVMGTREEKSRSEMFKRKKENISLHEFSDFYCGK